MTKKKTTKKPVKKARKLASMFDALKGIFALADVRYRTWKLRKWEGFQEYDGDIIVVGAPNNEGPYAQFCFDHTGFLKECTVVNDFDGATEQVCVDNIGSITKRVLDFATHKTTTTALKES